MSSEPKRSWRGPSPVWRVTQPIRSWS